MILFSILLVGLGMILNRNGYPSYGVALMFLGILFLSLDLGFKYFKFQWQKLGKLYDTACKQQIHLEIMAKEIKMYQKRGVFLHHIEKMESAILNIVVSETEKHLPQVTMFTYPYEAIVLKILEIYHAVNQQVAERCDES